MAETCGQQLDAVFGHGDAVAAHELAHGYRHVGGDAVLRDEGLDA